MERYPHPDPRLRHQWSSHWRGTHTNACLHATVTNNHVASTTLLLRLLQLLHLNTGIHAECSGKHCGLRLRNNHATQHAASDIRYKRMPRTFTNDARQSKSYVARTSQHLIIITTQDAGSIHQQQSVHHSCTTLSNTTIWAAAILANTTPMSIMTQPTAVATTLPLVNILSPLRKPLPSRQQQLSPARLNTH